MPPTILDSEETIEKSNFKGSRKAEFGSIKSLPNKK